MSATAHLTSLTFLSSVPSAAVPEADTYAMLLAGLGVLGWASRRQRRSREVS
ncbi:PEP-CTERM sorting domain-containing protein [Duganella sp. FT80W]|uniref:PEP-CTERM sorting domain-containing protein n=2 Tax=Duganella guangzhouensis TaxID=2666084 RepID=A0A6I2L273_9BURK|nr:PEP-CTERM sorting domain-containing protein [Duganella guangzhouensis]